MLDKEAGIESKNIFKVFKWLKYKFKFYRDNPDYFVPDGLLVFVGSQGSGKTLSAVNYVYRLVKKYPKSIIVTNLDLKDYPIDNIKVFRFRNNDDFMRYNNEMRGVIFLIDEIQLYLNSLESKNINIEVMTQIAQQRKQRKHIISTSQVFGRMAKPLREQFSSVIVCKCMFGCFQFNRLIDKDSIDGEVATGTNLTGKVIKRFFWVHDPDMYQRYDTYVVIDKNKYVSGEGQKGGLYDGYDIIVNTDNS